MTGVTTAAPFRTVDEIGAASGGYALEVEDGAIYIPIIAMFPAGQGKGSAFLDRLPKDRTIKVPGVISERLCGMLERRGFVAEVEWSPDLDCNVEVYVRLANSVPRDRGASR